MISRASDYDWFGSLFLLPIGMTPALVGSGGLMISLILVLLAVP